MAVRIVRKLSNLLDVLVSSPADGDVLAYSAADEKWENSAVAGGGATRLLDLTDVAGTDGAGKAPVSDGADTFTLTDIATQAELDAHAADTTSVHGITDTSVLETTSGAQAKADAAQAAAEAASQPLDSDLSAIAALATTAYGRALLALADAAALRTTAGLGTAATANTGDFDAAGAAAAAQAASQPLDSDLTAIAALTTTTFGRALLALADATALRSTAGLVIGTDVEAHDADLTTIAGLSPTNDDVLQRKAGAWTNRTMAQLIGDLAALGTTFQPLDSDLTSIAALATTAYGRGLLTLANAAAADWIPTASLDTDGTLAADSDTRVPSQKAVKTYVDANAGATTTASPKPLYHGQPASTGTDAYTVPAATTARILHIRCLNPDTASHTLDLYRYASGGSASDATRVTEKITIPASSSFEADVYLPMNTGDVLRAVADVSSKVTLYLGGDEITSALTEMPAPLYHGQPAAAGGAVYTVPAATTAIVRHLRCVNADTASHTLILYRYASGGSASDATRVTETITIPASSSWEDDVYLPMNAGDVLNAKADADSKVTLFVGGDEI